MLVNRPTDKESAAQVGDLSLSEGFHWKSLSESPSVQPVGLPPPSSDADTTETQTVPQVQDPDTAQAPSSTGPVKNVSIKAEPNVEGETEDLRREIGSGKRKRLKVILSYAFLMLSFAAASCLVGGISLLCVLAG